MMPYYTVQKDGYVYLTKADASLADQLRPAVEGLLAIFIDQDAVEA